MSVVSEAVSRIEPEQWVALAISFCACITDLRRRRIPNVLTLGGAGVALLFALATGGVGGLAYGVAGWCAGFAVFLPFFLLGGLGAGDVKLMACLGSWLGPFLAIWTAIYGALAGGVLAIVVAFGTGYLSTAVTNVYLLLSHFRVVGIRPHPDLTLTRGSGPRLPYAVPIAVGAAAALWLH